MRVSMSHAYRDIPAKISVLVVTMHFGVEKQKMGEDRSKRYIKIDFLGEGQVSKCCLIAR